VTSFRFIEPFMLRPSRGGGAAPGPHRSLCVRADHGLRWGRRHRSVCTPRRRRLDDEHLAGACCYHFSHLIGAAPLGCQEEERPPVRATKGSAEYGTIMTPDPGEPASVHRVSSAQPTDRPRVFLSYAQDDQVLAARISETLDQSDIPTTSQVWEVVARDWPSSLGETIRVSDVVVLLLGPAAVSSLWVASDITLVLSEEFDRRGVELIPVRAAPAELPPSLRDRAVVDLTDDFTEGLGQLVAQITATSQADFSAMTPRAFDDLVADMLQALGFHVDKVRQWPDPGVDLRATYQSTDPFGRLETEVWLVQAKLYSHKRVSVEAIRQLAGALAVASSATRGLLVTNAQLTSVAREYVEKLERTSQVRLGILDGLEVRRLLRRFPEVATRHFGGRAKKKLGRDGNS
jgi:Restriction endonuclease/TIR domain